MGATLSRRPRSRRPGQPGPALCPGSPCPAAVRVPPGPDAGIALAGALRRMRDAETGSGVRSLQGFSNLDDKVCGRPLPRRSTQAMNSTLPARGTYVLRPHGKLDAAAAAALVAMVGGE